MFPTVVKRMYILSEKFKLGKVLLRCASAEIDNVFVRTSSPKNHYINQNTFQRRYFSYGQPTSSTHPFLLSEGEVLPGLRVEEFQQRRRNLMDLIFTLFANKFSTHSKPVHHVVVIPSATKLYMTEKIPYVFHQNTDFLYLTGCLEPDTALVISGSCHEDMISTLFLQKPDSHSEMWDGPRTGIDVASQLFGVDEAFSMSHLADFLAHHALNHPNYLLHYDLLSCEGLSAHSVVTGHIQKFNITLYGSCKNSIDKLRLIKSTAEQNLMRKAGEISSLAIIEAMKITRPGITEHQLFASVDYESRMRGAEILAYVPVVASGKNANIIHYISNNQMTKEGELILMDAGCEYHGYCGDITRTWPVNGHFSKYQRILYEIVLEVENELIASCKERLPLDIMCQKMLLLLAQHLQSEKILRNYHYSFSELNEIARELCPHHVSHYLGMDIHDVKTIKKDISLTSGMIITVEPGVYTKENRNVAPEFWNLGIRVEDDVLITNTSYEILSGICPKEATDIERIMKK